MQQPEEKKMSCKMPSLGKTMAIMDSQQVQISALGLHKDGLINSQIGMGFGKALPHTAELLVSNRGELKISTHIEF